MIIPRFIQDKIEAKLDSSKVLLLYGTRRTGKTTIVENISSKYEEETLLLQGEDMQIANLLQERTISNYQELTSGKSIIIIDEAQAVPNIGKILKLMIDSIKGITILATGSSSFDLVYRTGEPLVGRNIIYRLYPFAQIEINKIEDRIDTLQNLNQRLIYGSYPELWHLNSTEKMERYLKQLVNSYLLKDLLMLETVKGADVLFKLLQLLAWQVGSQVSTIELGKKLQLNKKR